MTEQRRKEFRAYLETLFNFTGKTLHVPIIEVGRSNDRCTATFSNNSFLVVIELLATNDRHLWCSDYVITLFGGLTGFGRDFIFQTVTDRLTRRTLHFPGSSLVIPDYPGEALWKAFKKELIKED